MSTIYCKLKGGLANMLFQIAGATGIAKKYGLNVSFPNLNEHLNYLNQETTYNASLKHAEAYKLILGNINQTPPTNQLKYIHYPFQYTEIPLNYQDYLIEGFFQSEKYFINVRHELLQLLQEPLSVQKIIDEKYPHFSNRTTSIHVRRGDYLKNPNYHPIQPMSYYEEAMKILDSETDYYLVFSDDIEWCKNNFIGDKFVYIDSEIDYIELFLMARCNNNIIANSSFSWWGAWLNKNENKKVVAPTLWFGPIVGENTNDIIPENWIKI
jgi:hypothetical protein